MPDCWGFLYLMLCSCGQLVVIVVLRALLGYLEPSVMLIAAIASSLRV